MTSTATLSRTAMVTSLPTPPTGGTVRAGRVTGVHAAIDVLDVAGLREVEFAPVLKELERAKRRIEAATLTVLAAAERARVAERNGHTGTGSWAATHTKCGGAQGAAQSRLATEIEAGLLVTGKTLADGDISTEHAQVIAGTMRRLPDGLDSGQRDAVETRLVTQAKSIDPARLRTLARRALEAAQTSRAQVDEHEDALLRGQEAKALARTRLTMRDNGDGTSSGHFTVPSLAGAMLRKAIQQIASPRRDQTRQATGRACEGSEDRSTTYADTDWAHRYGLALLEILEHLPTDRLHGKVAATIVATIDIDRLRAGVGAVHLDTGHAVSAGEARRMACNAGILPAVLGGGSLPLDLGRADRFFTEAQRVALATVYTECAAHDCDRPYSWSELHHEDPWSAGGRTDLHLAVPLCGYHHRRMHDPGYAADIQTDSGGVKTVRYRQR